MKIGPHVNKDGLILHLDARSYRSYPRSGTIWYDLSGNNNHAQGAPTTAITGILDANFPIWQDTDGGRFYFDDSNSALTITGSMGSHTAITHEVWSYYDTSTGTAYFADARNGGGSYFLWNYVSKNINVSSVLTANDPITYQENSVWFDRWSHIVIASSGTTGDIYVDGQPIIDGRLSLSGDIAENLGVDFRIGTRYNGSNDWKGYFATYKIYNRRLTASEVLSNFNETRQNYGL